MKNRFKYVFLLISFLVFICSCINNRYTIKEAVYSYDEKNIPANKRHSILLDSRTGDTWIFRVDSKKNDYIWKKVSKDKDLIILDSTAKAVIPKINKEINNDKAVLKDSTENKKNYRFEIQGVKQVLTTPDKIKFQVKYYISSDYPKPCFIGVNNYSFKPAGDSLEGVQKGQVNFEDNIIVELKNNDPQPLSSKQIEVIIYTAEETLKTTKLELINTWININKKEFDSTNFDSTKKIAEIELDEMSKKGALCLANDSSLLFEVYNDSDYLFARAIIWKDNESKGMEDVGRGRKVHDYSQILFDVDNNKKRTAEIDINYFVNPRVGLDGLYFEGILSKNLTTGLKKDSEGEGNITFLNYNNATARVDYYKIALKDLKVKQGDKIALCFYGHSQKPNFDVNSVGYISSDKYYGSNLPLEKYHEYIIK